MNAKEQIEETIRRSGRDPEAMRATPLCELLRQFTKRGGKVEPMPDETITHEEVERRLKETLDNAEE